MADGTDILEKRQRLGELWKQQKDLIEKAKTEKREFTAEEEAEYDKRDKDLDTLDREINAAVEAEQRAGKRAAREAKVAELGGRLSAKQSTGVRPDVDDESRRTDQRTLARILPPAVRAKMVRDGREHEVRALEARAGTEYRDAFYSYLLGGDAALTPEEHRALSVGTDTEGGHTVPVEEFFPELIKAADNRSVIRQIARVLPPVVQAQALGAPSLTADPADADWTTELGTGSEDSTMAFGKREMQPWPVAKRIKVSKKLLRASPLMMDALVRDRLGYKLGVTHSKAFNTGDGASKPLGAYTPSALGIPASQDVEIGDGSAAVDPDKLITARFTLPEGYWSDPSVRWHMHRLWLAKLRKLKGTDNNYLWQPGLSAGAPSLFLDFPYSIDEYAPSVTTHGAGVYAAILAAWDFYWIVDALSMTIERLVELYAEANQVGFILRAETDGQPVLPEAFIRCIAAT
jgi:HK97 family phage major capsid protein